MSQPPPMSSQTTIRWRLSAAWQAWMRPRWARQEIARVLEQGYGHRLSASLHRPVDAQGAPLPWFTYPAIEYLSQFDFSRIRVFEYGAGNSTLFWGTRCAEVVSVESDAEWHRALAAQIPANVRLEHHAEPADYVAALASQPGAFDVIVVDGIERRACCRQAPPKLSPGGLVILDNADWYPGGAAVLREAGLLQVDMTGFGPVNGYTWTTSLFFHRDFAFPTREKVQPRPGIGSNPQVAD